MPPVAGRRVNAVSLVTSACLAAFVLAVVTLVVVDVLSVDAEAVRSVLASREIRHAFWLSISTSLVTLVLVVLVAIPTGYALSRYRFRGSVVLDALVDIPIVLPPVVIGILLLILLSTPVGRAIERIPGLDFVYTVQGIVLCQFAVSASFAVRASKAAFDQVDERLEHIAMTLGATRTRAFRTVALPMARGGLAAGAVMAWARAVGVFGPLMIVAGTVRMKTEVLPTTAYLELSVGRIQPALAVGLVMVAIAMVALVAIHLVESGGRWWGR